MHGRNETAHTDYVGLATLFSHSSPAHSLLRQAIIVRRVIAGYCICTKTQSFVLQALQHLRVIVRATRLVDTNSTSELLWLRLSMNFIESCLCHDMVILAIDAEAMDHG